MRIRTLPRGSTRALFLTPLVIMVSLPALLATDVGQPGGERSSDGNLIWSDEFDGRTLDLKKWSYRGLGPRRDGVNVKEAVTLDGRGHLRITTAEVDGKYHTGMIGTQGKFERAFGYFECRVKFQQEPGHWSAFWLQSPRFGQVIGEPAKSGTEIDVFEYLARRRDTVQHTLHWDGYGKHKKSAMRLHQQPGLSGGWHTIGVEWTKDEYVFYVDDRVTWRTKEAVSHVPQYVILSLEVGKWAGDIRSARLPDSVEFDYVRVYETKPRSRGSKPAAREVRLCPPATVDWSASGLPALAAAGDRTSNWFKARPREYGPPPTEDHRRTAAADPAGDCGAGLSPVLTLCDEGHYRLLPQCGIMAVSV